VVFRERRSVEGAFVGGGETSKQMEGKLKDEFDENPTAGLSSLLSD